jgi:hypothetical protein
MIFVLRMKTIITADNAVGTQAATNRKGACAGVLQRVGALGFALVDVRLTDPAR